jgi:hypothetical protein
MTGITAVHALERLGWRGEATDQSPMPADTLGPRRNLESGRNAGTSCLDCRLVIGLGSTRERGIGDRRSALSLSDALAT